MTDQVQMPSSQPSMPSPLAARLPEVQARIEQRPLNPGVTINERPGPLFFTAPHADEDGWRAQIMDAFGSNSMSIAHGFLLQLSDLCSRNWHRERWEPDELELVGILGIINSSRPENELQAALVVQMVAVHLTMTKLSGHVLRNVGVDKASAAIMARLASTYAMQCQTLDRLQGRHGRQEILVRYERHEHKHVHVEGEARKNEDQPYAPKARRTRAAADELAHHSSPDFDAVGTTMHGSNAVR